MEYGAIDLHTKHSQIRIVTADGAVVVERRIVTRADSFAAVFGGRARMRILLKSSTESEWVATCLEALGHEVVVADPNYAAMYGMRTRRIKTDRRDVAALAEANRTGIYRPAYRVSAAQRAIRQRLLVRSQLVRMRTQMINLLRSQVRATGRRVPTGAAETFARRSPRSPPAPTAPWPRRSGAPGLRCVRCPGRSLHLSRCSRPPRFGFACANHSL
jgi:transposase